MRTILFLCLLLSQWSSSASVIGMGIGGGGAMSGISFDPYKPGHLYIGTDMGLVYESFDEGKHWEPISQNKINFNVDLTYPSHMGFAPNGSLYWASGGCGPVVSHDKGVTWTPMKTLEALLPETCLEDKMRISYWVFSPFDKNIIIVGTTQGLLISNDQGETWSRYFNDQESLASLITDKTKVAHATNQGIFTFDMTSLHIETKLEESLGSASMGQDSQGLTIVAVEKTTNPLKRLFIKEPNHVGFTQQTQPVGKFVRMAPNNASIIYFTGNQSTGQGEAIWMSTDKGKQWSEIFTNEEEAYKNGKINANPVGLYVGFWDDEYWDFQVSETNPNVIAASGNFFFKISKDAGLNWQFPYSQLQTPNTPPSPESYWKSTQLNPVSILFLKRNPAQNAMIVAGLSDIGCVLSPDNGLSFRMCNIPDMNSMYDLVINPNQPNQFFAAASSLHDFPEDWYGDIQNASPGGIFVSDDSGLNWRLLTPNTKAYQNPYLSLAIDFKQNPCHIYAGTQGKGVVASFNCGKDWQRLNQGFEPMASSTDSSLQKGSLIFPSIKISPANGDVYALHSGNRLWESETNPFLRYTGLYKLNKKTMTWTQLGRPPQIKAPEQGGLYWKYPLDFVVDWNNPKNLYLIDMATAGTWQIGGLWVSSDGGASWQQRLQVDLLRRILMKEDGIYVVGWADPFIYKSTDKLNFSPMNIDIPLKKVDDLLVDDDAYWFGTFGGGIFKVPYK